ncbi:alkane 1-monooxygenase [Rhodobacteraceae bacterium]|nr:alkane 1-monooxygenase [Paracoccaceae bacterium]
MFSFRQIVHAAPFFLSLTLIPLMWIGGAVGGWTVFLVPLASWVLYPILDVAFGLNAANADTETPDEALVWHRLITWIWGPLQIVTVFAVIAMLVRSEFAVWEMVVVTFGLGIASGAVGIVYAHELMHQGPVFERRLGDLLMTSVLYGHFRSEHLLVHHRYVCTPRDSVTARYNEGFYRFFARVLGQCFVSAWRAEVAKLARAKRPFWDRTNPFWRYGVLQAAFLGFAGLIGGWLGVALFLGHAFVAIWQLELINYIEHYGLSRRHLGDGKYEHVQPRHSWNASHLVSNWFLINLQRHSDHHFKPDRRYPLLQTYTLDEAPQLPFGYAVMGTLAMVPPLWRRRMNPRVRAWRRQFYPDIDDWSAYKAGTLPMPR